MEKPKLKDLILEKSNIGIWVIELVDGDRPRMIADDCMRSLLGVDEGLTPEETYDAWYRNIHPDYYDAVKEGVEKMISGQHAEVQYPWYHPKKGMIYVRCGGVRDYSFTDGVRIEGCHQDVTKIFSYNKDPLTGLYNKAYFFGRVEEILAENPDKDYRILVSDIVNFKGINEKYGVELGDELLKYLASAECRVMGSGYVLAARINADKFVCLQEAKPQTREEGKRMEEEILKDSPVPNITWKHGIYYTKYDRNIPVQAMCDRARIAVDSIKNEYGVNCAVYNDSLHDRLFENQQIVDNMEEAINREEFTIYLQPKHDLHTNKTGGAEALVRWINPELGFMNPGAFIPLFEKNGFIKKLDRYVFTKVCELIRGWIDKNKPIVPVSVNLSMRDFEVDDLDKEIISLVDSYNIPHEYIHIEITESAFSDNPEKTVDIVEKLHNAGFVIELDDFGKGYSSLHTLEELDLDIIKLDMSLVKQDKVSSEKSLLDFCTQLVRMMCMKSVAEGVETVEQLERIKKLGCDYIQGYIFSKPLPVNEFEAYLCNSI